MPDKLDFWSDPLKSLRSPTVKTFVQILFLIVSKTI